MKKKESLLSLVRTNIHINILIVEIEFIEDRKSFKKRRLRSIDY